MLHFPLLLVVPLLLSVAEAKTGYFWHITDIHYDELYSTSGNVKKNCWQTDGGVGGAQQRHTGKFGDYNCDSPWALVQSAAKAMRDKHGDNIEFVLWTGDSISLPASRSSDHRMWVLKNLTDLLHHTFSSQFVFPVLGHEDPNPSLGQSYKEVADLWGHWLPTESLDTFSKGGYYTFEQKAKKLRIVALNTNLYVDMEGKEDDPGGQWEWLKNTLDKSRKHKETVYIVGHIPPGVDERQSGVFLAPHASFKEKFNKKYIHMVRKYSDVIVGQFFGHLHSDTFRIIYGDNGTPVSWLFIAPALSPRRSQSGANNPGIRLYKFDTNSGQVLDYEQFYLNLVSANQRHQADWLAEYNLTSYYGLPEVSPATLSDLAERFVTPEGAHLFARYYRANSVRHALSVEAGGCDASCTLSHYCAITRVDYTEFHGCLEAETSAFSARAATQGAGCLWLVLVAAVVVACRPS